MDLRGSIRFIQRWWWLLLFGPIVAVIPTYVWTKHMTPTYRATTTIFVNQSAQPGSISYQDALLNQQLVLTYTQIALQPVILADASNALGYRVTGVSSQPVRGTQLFQISATNTNPVRARDIADEVALVFINRQSASLPPSQLSTGLEVVQPALIPSRPVKPKLSLNLLLAFAFGIIVAVGLAKLLAYLDNTVKSPGDLKEAASLTLLGSVSPQPWAPHRTARVPPALVHLRVTSVDAPNPLRDAVEAYRRISTTLDFALMDSAPSRARQNRGVGVLVTSAHPGEGKSEVVANLAMIMAKANQRVIVVDGNLRRPAQHRIFGMDNRRGLADLLMGDRTEPGNYLQQTHVSGLWILPSGQVSPDLLMGILPERLERILAQLREQADIVLIDSPPVLAVSDALELSRHADATIFVVDATRTRAPQLHEAVEEVRKSGTPVLGGVLNKVATRGLAGWLPMLPRRPRRPPRTGNAAAPPADSGRHQPIPLPPRPAALAESRQSLDHERLARGGSVPDMDR